MRDHRFGGHFELLQRRDDWHPLAQTGVRGLAGGRHDGAAALLHAGHRGAVLRPERGGAGVRRLAASQPARHPSDGEDVLVSASAVCDLPSACVDPGLRPAGLADPEDPLRSGSASQCGGATPGSGVIRGSRLLRKSGGEKQSAAQQ